MPDMCRDAASCRNRSSDPHRRVSEVFVRVALDHPLPTLFDYRCDTPERVAPGMLLSVPFGKRHVVGLVCEVTAHSDVPVDRLRAVSNVCTACPPVSAETSRLPSGAKARALTSPVCPRNARPDHAPPVGAQR